MSDRHFTYPEHPGKIVTAGELTRAQIDTLEARIAELEAALRPFVGINPISPFAYEYVDEDGLRISGTIAVYVFMQVAAVMEGAE